MEAKTVTIKVTSMTANGLKTCTKENVPFVFGAVGGLLSGCSVYGTGTGITF